MRYGKIETDARKEIGYPQPSTIILIFAKVRHFFWWCAVHRLNGDWLIILYSNYIYIYIINLRYSQTLSERIQENISIDLS